MRKLLALLTTLTVLFALAACGSDSPATSGSESAHSPVASTDTTTKATTTSTTTAHGAPAGSTAAPGGTTAGSVSQTDAPTNTSTTDKAPASSAAPTGTTSTTSAPAPAPAGPTVHEDVITYTISYCGDGNTVVPTTFRTAYWKMPYGREDDGALTRKGYVLLGYSFDKNGGGELIRPGYKYVLPSKKQKQILYCVWAKETPAADFKVTETSSTTVSITGYTGSAKTVYIPRTISGKAVTGIAAGAFQDNATLAEVHVTSSVLAIEPGAFQSCKSLKTVTLYDNLQTVSDAAFAGCPITKVRLCAGAAPRYVASFGFGIKYERMIKTQGAKRVVVVAGSSAMFGINTAYMESLFEEDCKVVNWGTNGNMNIPLFLDAIAPLLTKKDVVIFAPEQYGPYAYHTNGNPEIPDVTFQGLSSCYNLFENLDASKYEKVFDSFGRYCKQASRMPALSWEATDPDLTDNGDRATIPSYKNAADFCSGANGVFRFNETVIPAQFIGNLNRVLDRVNGTGATLLFSYPPHNRNNVEAASLNKKAYAAYNDWISETVHCRLISDISHYIYNGEYFANTDYHMNKHGRKLHTQQLVKDIIAADVGIK